MYVCVYFRPIISFTVSKGEVWNNGLKKDWSSAFERNFRLGQRRPNQTKAGYAMHDMKHIHCTVYVAVVVMIKVSSSPSLLTYLQTASGHYNEPRRRLNDMK